jgi:hypothetical protein
MEQNLNKNSEEKIKINGNVSIKNKTEHEKGEISLFSYLYKLNKKIWKRGFFIILIPFIIIFAYSKYASYFCHNNPLCGIEVMPFIILIIAVLTSILARVISDIFKFYFSRK